MPVRRSVKRRVTRKAGGRRLSNPLSWASCKKRLDKIATSRLQKVHKSACRRVWHAKFVKQSNYDARAPEAPEVARVAEAHQTAAELRARFPEEPAAQFHQAPAASSKAVRFVDGTADSRDTRAAQAHALALAKAAKAHEHRAVFRDEHRAPESHPLDLAGEREAGRAQRETIAERSRRTQREHANRIRRSRGLPEIQGGGRRRRATRKARKASSRKARR